MKDEWRQVLEAIAMHPATPATLAAVVRWVLGDRKGGWKALGTYLVCSLIVAWGGSLYLADEVMSSARRGFWLLLLAFAAKDLLIALLAIASQFKVDPIGLLQRLREALAGGPRP